LTLPPPLKPNAAVSSNFFETAFELAWKTLKDYLESEGVDTKTPRETIKQAFQTRLLADGHVWIKILDDRNMMSHTYDDEESRKVERLIRNDYFPRPLVSNPMNLK
jgi:nucleotidyltransferase substrate binding protein (TIGR01987 family)